MKKGDIVTKKEHCPKKTRSEALSILELSNKKCDRRRFQSSKQSYLRKHKISHDCGGPKGELLSSKEIATGKCDSCNYKTQRKSDLRMHKKRRCCLRNKVRQGEILSSIEIATSKCDNCDYKTQRKFDLRMHKKRRSCLQKKVTTCQNSDFGKNEEMFKETCGTYQESLHKSRYTQKFTFNPGQTNNKIVLTLFSPHVTKPRQPCNITKSTL